MTSNEPKILQEGRTCWRVAPAGRAAVLVDAAAYFGALRQALLAARRSVFIAGWDIDSRVELMGEAPDESDEAPRKLGELLGHLVDRRPELQVHVLLWDYSVLYALDREPLPAIKLDWATPRQIKVCLDDVLPLGACHHQKIVVIDDALAFCGGLDLTARRWDTPEHRPDDPRRRDPSGASYGPFHDIQMCVDGEAARSLAEVVRRRWLEAACERPLRVEPTGDPWPRDLVPDFTEVEVAVARTLPALDGGPDVREVEALYLAAIDRAQEHIYIENQFLTADVIAERLARRLSENRRLEALLVAPGSHETWLEARSMEAGRRRFMQRLHDAGAADRVRLVHPVVAEGDSACPVLVHAKLMIVDDRFLRVGSSNLANRSMGLDSECDLAIEAAGDTQRRAIAGIRARLLGEHLGVSAARFAETFEARGSLLETMDALAGEERDLRPIRDADGGADPLVQAVSDLADPERPVESTKYVGDMFGGQPASRVLGAFGRLALVSLALIALAFVWQFTPLSGLADLGALPAALDGLTGRPWAPLTVLALYVVAGLIAFPFAVLIALTAMVLEPWPALLYAGAGSLTSAAVTFGVGAIAGRDVLRGIIGRRLNRIGRALARKDALSVTASRLMPSASFTLVNLVAGAIRVRFRAYLLGTLLGMAPGVVLLTALGHRLARVLGEPGIGEIALLALITCLWLGVSAGLQIVVSRLRSSTDG